MRALMQGWPPEHRGRRRQFLLLKSRLIAPKRQFVLAVAHCGQPA